MKSERLEDHIQREIQKTGFPLEIEIQSILEAHNWITFPNEYYFDTDEKKAREIDLSATPAPEFDEKYHLKNPVEPFALNTELVIECKKSETHAWVFFTRPSNSCFFISGQRFDSLQFNTKDFSKSLFDEILPPPDTGGLIHYCKFDRLASSYVEVKLRKEERKSYEASIFTASNQLMNFISYSFQQRSERLLNSGDKVLTIVFPVIVFDGNLYEATLNSKKKLILSTRKHILLRRVYTSLNV